MTQEEFLCVRCARHMKTCCQTSEVHPTQADVRRIADYSGRSGFTEYRVPENENYLDQDDDPAWSRHVFRADKSRRVLKRKSNGDCTFLGDAGCVLPLETRPLVCRLYPYDYTEQGLLDELTPGCPLELLAPAQGLIEALDMNADNARRWHKQLYSEIRMESESE